MGWPFYLAAAWLSLHEVLLIQDVHEVCEDLPLFGKYLAAALAGCAHGVVRAKPGAPAVGAGGDQVVKGYGYGLGCFLFLLGCGTFPGVVYCWLLGHRVVSFLAIAAYYS